MCCSPFHPFSPTSPFGFTIKKNSNINILIASDKSGIKYAVKAPANPTIKEAMAEPCTLPSPPMITTMKAKIAYYIPISAKITPEYGANKKPPNAAIPAPNKKTKENIAFTLIPSA